MHATASILATALLLLPLAAPAGGREAGGTGAPPAAAPEARPDAAGAAASPAGQARAAAASPADPASDNAPGAAPGAAAEAAEGTEGAAANVAYEVVEPGTIRIPAGTYMPLYGAGEGVLEMPAFSLDRRPVTRAEFAAFLADHPAWRRDRVKRIFADEGYLALWPATNDPGNAVDAARPATEVSWFAAQAYCQAQGQRLPTVDEWEYAATRAPAGVGATAWKSTVLTAANRRARGAPAPVGSGLVGAWGLRDLHGLVQEWTMDFNSVVVSSDSRGTGARDRGLYCASSARGAADVGDYAAFLRYAFRASVDGRGTTANLGFRCAGG
ncbi:MAG: formylglycine-generating enzyme family protein [Gemmatimonadota bacterium]